MGEFNTIGWVECKPRYRYEAPRQGVLGGENRATIHLNPDCGYEAALDGLAGFERLWLIYELHLNESWRPYVQPPHAGIGRQGVFATRSPHRPNRIGLSCVRLLAIYGLTIEIGGHDLLDKTPILDIKPYLPYADAFPDASVGWLNAVEHVVYTIIWGASATEKAEWVNTYGSLDCMNFVHVQLREDPDDCERKRIVETDGRYVIAFRTWRITYHVERSTHTINVIDIDSGYSVDDLAEPGDRHGDKSVHRQFMAEFCRPAVEADDRR